MAGYTREIDPGVPGPDSAIAIVAAIIEQYKHLIEDCGLWKELWSGDKPRHEHSAQRQFLAVALSYCAANNLDVSPETDAGGGPIDFKFSLGYNIRILVELKLSPNRLVHGYEKQLKVYAEAERPIHCFYVIVDIGKMGEKLQGVLDLKNAAVGRGEKAADVEVIDGKPRPSASKR